MMTLTRHHVEMRVAAPPAGAEAGMILMDSSFQPFAMDSGAASILRGLSKDREWQGAFLEGDLALPNCILEALREAPPDDLTSLQIGFRVGQREYNARAYLTVPQHGRARQPYVMLNLQRAGADCGALARIVAEYRLTEREREALEGLSNGLTNKELAERMDIKLNTVKAFLRTIMLKMDVSSRSGILAKLLSPPIVDRSGIHAMSRSRAPMYP